MNISGYSTLLTPPQRPSARHIPLTPSTPSAHPLRPIASPNVGRCDYSRSGNRNTVVTGTGTRCHLAQWADPISIKAVKFGEIEWRIDRRRYLIRPDTLLLLPDGDEYSMTIDSVGPSSGFCAVFRRGLVEECWRAAVSSHETLLETPDDIRPLPFQRRLEARTGLLGQAIDALTSAVAVNASPEILGWLFEALGERVVQSVLERRLCSMRVNCLRGDIPGRDASEQRHRHFVSRLHDLHLLIGLAGYRPRDEFKMCPLVPR
jgi:AraC-like ligand binding domain